MAHLLSYTSGIVGYGLSDDLDIAIEEAIVRCTEMCMGATIVNQFTYVVVAVIQLIGHGYVGQKME